METELNPWKSMWTNPRQTMNFILRTEPIGKAILFGIAGGIFRALDQAALKHGGDKMGLLGIIVTCIFAGVIGGLITLFAGGGIIKITGRLLGGKATFEGILAAMGWSYIIVIWAGILWIPELLLFGIELFKLNTPLIDSSAFLTTLYYVCMTVELVLSLWGFIVFLKCLAEVQEYSAWKALLNILVPFLLMFVAIFLIIEII